jgi:hypothetical protein
MRKNRVSGDKWTFLQLILSKELGFLRDLRCIKNVRDLLWALIPMCTPIALGGHALYAKRVSLYPV